MRKNLLTIMLVVLSFTHMAYAADDKDFAGCDGSQVILGTGLPTAVYSQMMKVPFKMVPDLMCEYRGSSGGPDNIQAMVERKIDAGIVQADVTRFMERTEPMVTKKVRALLALHSNYAHPFVLKAGFKEKKNMLQKQTVVIRNLRDAANRTVVTFGSGTITAMTMNERLGYNMKIKEVFKKEDGFAMLKSGEAAVFFNMGGKPIPWVDKEVDGNIFTLANIDTADTQKLGQPYFAGKLTYKKLGVVGINTVAVRNDLVVWDFTGKRAQQLLEIKKFFRENLEDIKDSRGAHPAWQDIEVSTLDDVSWQKFQPGSVGSVAKSAKKKR